MCFVQKILTFTTLFYISSQSACLLQPNPQIYFTNVRLPALIYELVMMVIIHYKKSSAFISNMDKSLVPFCNNIVLSSLSINTAFFFFALRSEISALVSMKCTIVLTVSIFLHFSGVPALNTISGLLDLSLFWSVVTTGSLVLFLWTFGCKLLVIFYTQVGCCFRKIPTHSEKILQYDSVSLSPSSNYLS